jgi:peptidoglycan hydrolase-like protein with peptidoglycan-binding domain
MSRHRAILAAGTSLVAAALFTGAPMAPASAATPQCTQSKVIYPQSASSGNYAPAASNGSTNCWMARGNNSGGVWALQRALRYCYGKNIALDSDFGPATQSALRSVQDTIGAAVDGEYGPETAGKINFSGLTSTARGACYPR